MHGAAIATWNVEMRGCGNWWVQSMKTQRICENRGIQWTHIPYEYRLPKSPCVAPEVQRGVFAATRSWHWNMHWKT